MKSYTAKHCKTKQSDGPLPVKCINVNIRFTEDLSEILDKKIEIFKRSTGVKLSKSAYIRALVEHASTLQP